MKAKVGASANVQKTTQNSNSSWDNTSQARAGSIWDAANKAGNTANPLQQEAQGTFSGLQKGGNLGFAALTGDADAAGKFMNPYQKNVIDANNAEWNNVNAQTVNRTNDLATKANAFGGSRHGVAEGVALGENARAQATQTAGLLNSGFDASMARAGQAANLGFGAAQQNLAAMSPEERRLYLMKQGFLGPQGQQSSGAQTTFGGKLDTSGSIGF